MLLGLWQPVPSFREARRGAFTTHARHCERPCLCRLGGAHIVCVWRRGLAWKERTGRTGFQESAGRAAIDGLVELATQGRLSGRDLSMALRLPDGAITTPYLKIKRHLHRNGSISSAKYCLARPVEGGDSAPARGRVPPCATREVALPQGPGRRPAVSRRRKFGSPASRLVGMRTFVPLNHELESRRRG